MELRLYGSARYVAHYVSTPQFEDAVAASRYRLELVDSPWRATVIPGSTVGVSFKLVVRLGGKLL